MSKEQMSNEISAFEAQLGRLVPAGVVDEGELMFQAGRAAERNRRRRWQFTAVAALLLAVASATLSFAFPRVRVVEVERIVHVTAPAAADTPEPDRSVWAARQLSEYSYLRLRNKALAEGLGALPKPTAGPAETESSRRLLDKLLRG